jgi:hypothetical protein
MNKKKTARVAGFVGALGASALLLGAAANTTGAYFTDSHDGAINSSTGQVKVDTTDLQLNFDQLLPGEYKTQRVDYTARGTGSEDLWMVFPTDGSAEALVGTAGDSAGGGLGRFGHLQITSTGGASFVSNNLNNAGTGSHSGDSCGIDGNGWGGSSQEAADSHDNLVPFCAPKNAILLQSGMNSGDTGYANVEFGFTKLLHGQNAPHAQVAKFKIVATQHGIRPDNPNN